MKRRSCEVDRGLMLRVAPFLLIMSVGVFEDATPRKPAPDWDVAVLHNPDGSVAVI
jgi:hypothetical protein